MQIACSSWLENGGGEREYGRFLYFLGGEKFQRVYQAPECNCVNDQDPKGTSFTDKLTLVSQGHADKGFSIVLNRDLPTLDK